MSQTIETIFKVTASIVGANALKEFSGQIDKASTNGQRFARSLNQGAIALKAFAASAAVIGIKNMISSAIDLGAEIDDISQKTGVAVETLGRLQGAAIEGGTSLDAVAGAMVKLNKTIIDAQDGTGKAAAAFKELGIDVRDGAGELKTAEEIFFELSDRFAGAEDGAGKVAAAMALMGKSGAEMIPLLNKGSEEIQRLGIQMGPEFAQQSGEFQDNLDRIKMRFTQLTVDIASQLLPGLVKISEGFSENNVAVDMLVGLLKGLQLAFVGWQRIASTAVNGVGLAFAQLTIGAQAAYEKINALMTMDWAAFQAADVTRGRNSKAAFDAYVAEQLESDQKVKEAASAIMNGRLGEVAAVEKPRGTVGGSNTANGSTPTKTQINFNPDAGSKAASEYEKAAKAAGEWISKQQQSIITMQEEATYIGLTTVEVAKLKDARAFEAEVAEKTLNMSAQQAEAFKKQAAEVGRARQAVIQYNYDQSRTFGAGAREFFTSYSETVTNTAEQVKSVLTNAFKGAEDALVEFTTTGKLNFKSFASSIIQDIIRIQIRRSIIAPVSNFLGGLFGGVTASANGNVMTGSGPMPLNKYAKGGIARSPQLSIFGEGSQPEAYVPLPDGRTIPVTMTGGGGVGNVSVVVNIDKSGNANQSEQADGSRASNFGRSIAAAVKAQILEEQRPGGLLAGRG